MAGKNTKGKRDQAAALGVDDADDIGLGDSADIENPEVIESAEEDDDPFADLFAADERGRVPIVQLIRLAPKGDVRDPETGQLVSLTGYLEDLRPGLESYNAYIRDQWGGGQYACQAKVRGRIVRSVSVNIGGVPAKVAGAGQISPSPSEKRNPEPVAQSSDELAPVLNVGGLSIDLRKSMDEILRMSMMANFVRSMFPQPVDLSMEIVQALLGRQDAERKASDPLAQFEMVSRMMEAVKSMMPDSPAANGKSWPDILDTALVQFGELVRSGGGGSAPQGNPALRPALPQPQSETNQLTNNKETEEMPRLQLSPLDRARAAAGLVINAFRTELTPEEAVQQLDDNLGLDDATRVGVVAGQKSRLLSLSKVMLAEVVDVDSDLIKSFTGYFTEVFDLYVQRDRVASPLADQ